MSHEFKEKELCVWKYCFGQRTSLNEEGLKLLLIEVVSQIFRCLHGSCASGAVICNACSNKTRCELNGPKQFQDHCVGSKHWGSGTQLGCHPATPCSSRGHRRNRAGSEPFSFEGKKRDDRAPRCQSAIRSKSWTSPQAQSAFDSYLPPRINTAIVVDQTLAPSVVAPHSRRVVGGRGRHEVVGLQAFTHRGVWTDRRKGGR